MAGTSHDDLRRLAVWLARRRDVDELMAVLTRYGPTAGEQVAGHLDGLQSLLDAESEAFQRYRSGAPVVPQRPLPTLLVTDGALAADEPDPAHNVHSLAAARTARGAP